MVSKPGRNSSKKLKWLKAMKWVSYLIMLAVVFVYSTTPITGMPKPLLFIPMALAIAMGEQELPAVGIGLAAGFMMDVACDKLLGFNAFLMAVFCLITSLLFLHLLRQNALNLWWISVVATILQGCLDFLFFFAIWRQPDLSFIFFKTILPSMALTAVLAPLVHLAVKIVHRIFSPPQERHMEEKNENISRE